MAGSILWTGVEALQAALTEKQAAASEATHLGIATAAHLVEARMKERAGEGGRHKKGTPTPAAKGGGPAVITGTLRRSIRVGPIVSTGTFGWSTQVGPTAIYGRRVELEYDYPFAGPGFADARPELPGIFAAAWAKAWAG